MLAQSLAYGRFVLLYHHRLHDTTGDDLAVVEHPAPNVEPGDVVEQPSVVCPRIRGTL